MASKSDVDEKLLSADRRNRRRLLKNRIYDIAHRSAVYFMAGTTALLVGAVLFEMGYLSIVRYPAISKERKLHDKYLLNSDELEKK